MKPSAVKKFLSEHIFETTLAALVSLATAVGGYLLVSIRNEVDDLQCRISQFAANNEYKTVQLKLIVTPLDDLKRDSAEFRDLENIVNGYRKSLSKCEEGKEELTEIDDFRLGLEKFIDRDWDSAIKYFNLIKNRNSLTEKAAANTLLHKYSALKAANDPKAADFDRQWRARLASAQNLATKESDTSVKKRAVNYLKCARVFLDQSPDEAIGCFSKLVETGDKSYGVYYNLAALHARKGDFKSAISYFSQCMEMPGALTQRRSDVEQDEDFSKLLADPTYGAQFRSIILRLEN